MKFNADVTITPNSLHRVSIQCNDPRTPNYSLSFDQHNADGQRAEQVKNLVFGYMKDNPIAFHVVNERGGEDIVYLTKNSSISLTIKPQNRHCQGKGDSEFYFQYLNTENNQSDQITNFAS